MAKVHMLGTGTPTPTPFRFGSSHVLEVAGEYLMFDCGPAATHKLVKAGLWPTQVDYLFSATITLTMTWINLDSFFAVGTKA